MKQVRGFISFVVLICALLLLMTSCEYEGPDPVWNPNYDLGGKPEIDSLYPNDMAVAGISQIVINGRNFSADISKNTVYFGNAEVVIKKAEPEQLIVYRPNLAAEDFAVKVAVEGSVLHAEYSPYTVESIGGLLTQAKDVGLPNALAVDANGTLYLHVNKKDLYRVTELGDLELLIGNTKPRSVNDMKAGPDGYLYLARDRNFIYRVQLTGEEAGEEKEFEEFAAGAPGNIKSFDFTEDLNILAGGAKTGLIRIYPDGTSEALGVFEDLDIQSLRVYDQSVYVAALYGGDDPAVPDAGIWKTDIPGNGSGAGEQILVLDWAETGDFSETQFSDINFDINGTMYVATDGGPDRSLDPILMLTKDGEVDTFYKGGLLHGAAYDLVWGQDARLYYLIDIGDVTVYEIYRLGMAAGGAPQYGRQ
ncbi:IPT/TIG domain-containing protein [bacterium]|nr:IPT/TIG domain-containing protein [bacterium]